MRKLSIIVAVAAILGCLFAMSVGAKELTRYCDAKITLTSGETVTAYFEIGSWNGKPSVARDTIYKTTNTDDGTYDWSDVEILDMRDFNYTEGYAPEYMSGTACNQKASNVTTIYLPPTMKQILHTSFTSGWKSLDTVYIPKSLESINYDAFHGSAIRNVVIEDGSNLKTIESQAFRNCQRLESINLPEGLESIGYCAFYITNLSGKFVVPNSVTTIGDGAFRNTKIETLVLGDGPITLGYNLIGEPGYGYLKEVYIPAEAVYTNGHTNDIFFASKSMVTFYVIGNDCSAIIEKLRIAPARGYMKIITEEEAKTAEVGTYNAVIKEGYNKCDAFYNGNHSYKDEAELTFTDFTASFMEKKECVVCKDKLQIGDTYLPIFDCHGYSTKENGTAMCVGYSVNNVSLEKYYEYYDELKYGMVASVISDGQGLDLLEIKNGDVSVNSDYNSIIAPVSSNYSSFDFILKGFKTEHSNLNVVLCLYVFDGKNAFYITETSNKTPLSVTLSELK